jgi:glycosidase
MEIHDFTSQGYDPFKRMRMSARFGFLLCILATGCHRRPAERPVPPEGEQTIVIYQVFTRLFGNTDTTNLPWGTIEMNGVGKFEDFTPRALEALRELGVSHIWYTGVLHHAMVTDYSEWGLPGDDPDVVKGRAGSPYSVKDYYNVNPDLATDPSRRLEEFEALIERTHQAGMKVIIDIVPNHVARVYHSVSNPPGVEDFGASDDTTVAYRRDNNFYYIIGQPFRVPQWRDGYRVLGGEAHPFADGMYHESPARWTGNGSRSAQPDMYDWYEAVKVNFGIRPDGARDFDSLPPGYENEPFEVHYEFWRGREVPDSWVKFREIALFWIGKGVDGFRFDMAEMVPVEFWSYLNSAIKMAREDAFLLAEIYQPGLYRDYIRMGKMDYLYDKVELYDTLKRIMQGHGSTDHLLPILEGQRDISHHMLHFLENHDEQRIASDGFTGDAQRGKPAMVVSATISSSPTMIYFAQEVGEPGEGDAGFGSPTRTTIYDYWGISSHIRWMNDGAFDGGQLTAEEKELREFYRTLLNFTRNSPALLGEFREIHSFNRAHVEEYNDRIFSYVRWKEDDRLIIVANFDASQRYGFDLRIPGEIIRAWNLKDGSYALTDQMIHSGNGELKLHVSEEGARVSLEIGPLESMVLSVVP